MLDHEVAMAILVKAQKKHVPYACIHCLRRLKSEAVQTVAMSRCEINGPWKLRVFLVCPYCQQAIKEIKS